MPVPVPIRAAHAAPKVPVAPSRADAALDAGIGVNGSQVVIFQPDPHRPGRFLFKIWAAGVRGVSPNGSVQGTLSQVSAVLFQQGQASARLRAPQADADSAAQTVTATGGVHVFSLLQPGTTLVADRVTWRAKQNTVTADGHVVYVNGRTGLTVRVPHLTADTALRTFSSAGAGAALLPGKR